MVTSKQGESGSPFPFDEDSLTDNVEEDSLAVAKVTSVI